jgi:hypothetical protein
MIFEEEDIPEEITIRQAANNIADFVLDNKKDEDSLSHPNS